MKQNTSWFDRMMTAVTFAEANEHETGKEILNVTGGDTLKKQQVCEDCGAILATDLQGAEAQS